MVSSDASHKPGRVPNTTSHLPIAIGRPNASGSDELAALGAERKKTCLFSVQCHETSDCETDD